MPVIIVCPSCGHMGPHTRLGVTLVCRECDWEWGNPFFPHDEDPPGGDPYDLAEFACPKCLHELVAPWQRCPNGCDE